MVLTGRPTAKCAHGSLDGTEDEERGQHERALPGQQPEVAEGGERRRKDQQEHQGIQEERVAA